MSRLVLWDIDGTILHGGRLWKECFEESLRDWYERGSGRAAETPWSGMPRISFSGKTDRQICRELLAALELWPAGVVPGSEPAREAWIDAILRGYLDRARERVPSRKHEIKIMPGVRAAIEALEGRPDVTLGLLTGNVREGAELKLESVDLGGRFAMGVFGDDHWDRYQLPAIAIRRAREDLGREFDGKQVVIIGDTIHDVGCGQSVGARAIAVGTGHRESRDRVHAAWRGTGGGDYARDPRPHSYFEDLSDVDALVASILE